MTAPDEPRTYTEPQRLALLAANLNAGTIPRFDGEWRRVHGNTLKSLDQMGLIESFGRSEAKLTVAGLKEARRLQGEQLRQSEAEEHPDFEGDGPPVSTRRRIEQDDIPPVPRTALGVLAHARHGMPTTGPTTGITDVELPALEPELQPEL